MEGKINKILFTTDLTPEAKHVFEYVKKLVASTGASVTVVHILEKVDIGVDEMLSHFLGEQKWKQFKKEKIESVKTVLIGKVNENRMIREAIGSFLECMNNGEENGEKDKIIVEEGIPSDKIIELAKLNNCEVIIAGMEKRSVLGVTYVGGTLKDILRKSDIPVLVVPYVKGKK